MAQIETTADQDELKNSNYELFILALSLLSILNIVLTIFLQDQQVTDVIFFVDLVLSAIFMLDFLYRLFSAESKRTYFIKQYGWLDFIGSLPFPGLRIARLGRIARAIRLLRKYGLKNMVSQFLTDRAGSALFAVLLLAILMIEFGSIAILFAESRAADANINSAGDALWWSLVTMSTVGYGDQYPITQNGRIIASFFVVMGVGLFGVITGFLANAFLADDKDDPDESLDLQAILHELREIKESQGTADAEINTRLAALESLLHAK